MLKNIPINRILFLDIETVPQSPFYEEMDEISQKLWNKKAGFLRRTEAESAESLYTRAGIYAEFGKIVCICAGLKTEDQFDIFTFSGREELPILRSFASFLNKQSHRIDSLCAHNGKEFDFPYLCRRMIVNQIPLPDILNIAGKKPWEIKHFDTMELWKFGDWKNFTSLETLTHILNIPSPKQEMDGSDVGRVFWQEDGLQRIEEYCRQDVMAVFRIMLHYQGKGRDANDVRITRHKMNNEASTDVFRETQQR